MEQSGAWKAGGEDGAKTAVSGSVLELGCSNAYLVLLRLWLNPQHHTRQSSSGLESCHLGGGDDQNFKIKGWGDSSVSNGLAVQTWGLEFESLSE